MASSTRIPKAEITGVSVAMVKTISKKWLGEAPSPPGVYWNNRPVLKGDFHDQRRQGPEGEVRDLQPEVVRAHGGRVAGGLHLGASTTDTSRPTARTSTWRRRARCLVWRESDVFTPLEREVMMYAEAMSQTHPPGYPINGNRR